MFSTFMLILNGMAWGVAGSLILLVVAGSVWVWRFLPYTARLLSTLFMGTMVGMGIAGKDLTLFPDMAREILPKFMTTLVLFP